MSRAGLRGWVPNFVPRRSSCTGWRQGPSEILVSMSHTFSCKYSSFTIQSHGAHVTSWKSAAVGNGEQELLYVSPQALMDTPEKAIRGGVPICWPQFSEMGPYGMAHGWARSTKWDLLSADKATEPGGSDSVSITFSLPKNAAEGLNPEKVDSAFFSNFDVLFPGDSGCERLDYEILSSEQQQQG